MVPPRSAFGASPFSGRSQWPGKAGRTGARGWVLGVLLALMSGVAMAQTTPVGLWRSIDDNTGAAKAEIRIREGADGVLTGVIERALIKSEHPNCDLCTDDRKGQPKVGMEIIRGARKVAEQILEEDGGSGLLQIQVSENVPKDAWRESYGAIADAIDAHPA